MSAWESLKRTGLPVLVIGFPSFLWLMVTCTAVQCAVLPLYYLGMKKQYYQVSSRNFALLHLPLLYLFEYSGTEITLWGKDIDDIMSRTGTDQSMILVNHRGDLDWLVGLLMLHTGGGMGCCKAIIKQALVLVPFLGFIWWAVDFVTVSRSWASDSIKLQAGFHRQHIYQETNTPYCLSVFPEGTRLSKTKLEDGQEFARSRGLPVLNHLLMPRVKGVWSAINGLKLDSVFDCTLSSFISEHGKAANMATMGQGKSAKLDFYMGRHLPADIPKEEEALGKWLYALWEKKDKQLDTYQKEKHLGKDMQKRVLTLRPSAFYSMCGIIIYWMISTVVFVNWCINTGRHRFLAGCTFAFASMIVIICFSIQKVHFTKSTHGASGGKKAKDS